MESNWLNVKEAAGFLKIARSTLYRLAETGELGPMPVRVGGGIRYNAGEIQDWMLAGCPNREKWVSMKKIEDRKCDQKAEGRSRRQGAA